MKNFRKVLAIVAVTLISFCTVAISVYAANDSGVYEAYTWSKGTVGVTARFIAGNNYTGSSPRYGADPGRYLKRSRVRLIEGSYDKTSYSPYAHDTQSTHYATASLSKSNNIFLTAEAYWHWEYY